eukprot:TRINITY_DN11652_c0_g1_i2.p1 TRINITY_DN11652_c0_g1~~TRINITY_DN11652_c0_g1_i2.p1  ORF type:complete len:115 (+),score=41.53 TRINITY_DN11652_c0_g1_i2:107-451(+)
MCIRDRISALGRVGKVECRSDRSLEGCVRHVINPKLSVYLQVKGAVDLQDEIKRLNKKVNQLEEMLQKLEKKMKVRDYEVKVPEEVRLKNKEKLLNTANEISILKKCIADIKLI